MTARAEWLSPGWAEQASQLTGLLPAVAGASGRVSLAFSTGPRQEVGFHWRYEAGAAVDAAVGVDADADLVLSLASVDAADTVSGRVPPSVAFMRGRLKASGDGTLLLAFLRSSVSDGFSEWVAALAAISPVP